MMTRADVDEQGVMQNLAHLRREHGDLDQAIRTFAADPACDELALLRMKKRKLMLKDAIATAYASTIPDIIA